MGMLMRCAKEFGWSHKEMMDMPSRVLKRYYGIWLIEKIQDAERQEREEARQRMEESRKNANWKSF